MSLSICASSQRIDRELFGENRSSRKGVEREEGSDKRGESKGQKGSRMRSGMVKGGKEEWRY